MLQSFLLQSHRLNVYLLDADIIFTSDKGTREIMGNGFAYLMLAVWPLISIWLYRTKTIQIATLWTILGGFMFLAARTVVDLPMIPPMGKNSIPILSALIGCWFIKKQHISFLKGLGVIKYLVFLLIFGPFITASLNTDAIIAGVNIIPGLTYYDGLSTVINKFLLVVPFFIGRQLFRTYENQLLMFKVLVIAGLSYSILILFEIRMSPQLHTWVYGYFPHSFAQTYRSGGWRPVVFMEHGLIVSFFVVIVLISAITLWNNRVKIRRFSPALLSYYFLAVLILCKSLASLFYGMFAFFLLKNTKPKTQHRVAIILVTLAILYPAMSIMKIFPHETILNVASAIDINRASSLQFRFDNENILLEHGQERFFFGWGPWGRNRVYHDETGIDLTTTDGRWVLTFGQFGIVGFIGSFGLLVITVLRANSASKLVKSKPEQTLLAAHALLVGIILIDQLPNASLSPWLWLLSGILLGRSEDIIEREKLTTNFKRESSHSVLNIGISKS